MNNLFHAFSIKVPGQFLDDKLFYTYEDFDAEDLSKPTDEQTVEKGKAYIRMQQLKRKLSELCVPVYCTVNFGTPGTCATIPTDAEIVVGYITYEPFLAVTDTAPVDPTADAAATVMEIVEGVMDEVISDTFCTVQLTVNRLETAIPDAATVKFREIRDIYLTAPAVTVTPTVTYVEIK